MPLKSYKYSSVDKSFISNYILRHYVRTPIPDIDRIAHMLQDYC